MAAKALKITMMLMVVMVVKHIESATSDSQACKGDCVETCTVAEEVDFDCFFTCVEKCDDDDDDDYPPILTGISPPPPPPPLPLYLSLDAL